MAPEAPIDKEKSAGPGLLFVAFLQIALSGFGGVLPWARRVLVRSLECLRFGFGISLFLCYYKSPLLLQNSFTTTKSQISNLRRAPQRSSPG